MTHDPAKFPRAQPLPKRREIDALIDRLDHYMRFSITDAAKKRYARELVQAKKARGDYDHLGEHVELDTLADTALAEMEAERRG